MQDEDMTREQLLAELGDLRRQVGGLKDTAQRNLAALTQITAQLQREVKDHRRAEEALGQSEKKYRSLVDACPDAVVMAALDGRVLFASPQTWTLLGLDKSDELIGRSVFDFVIEEHRSLLAANLVDVVKQGIRRNTEYTVLRKDGTMVPTEASSVSIRDAEDRPVAAMAVIRDITDRKKAEAAIKQSHSLLQAIYDGAVDGLLVIDVETQRFLKTNTAMCRMLGYSEQELLSLSAKEVHRPEDVPRLVEQFQAMAEGRLLVSEDTPFLRKDGTVFHAMITTSRITYEGRRCVTGFIHDVTAQRLASQRVRESEEKYRRLIEASPDAVMMIDPQARVVFASPLAVELYGGTSAAEMCGRPIWSLVAEEERPRAIAAMSALMKEGVRRRNEYVLLHKDGTAFPGEISSSTMKNEEGELLGIISIVRDITERKQAQAALQQEHRTLKHLLQSSDHERQIIAYEIHDGLAQQLAGAIMQFQVYEHSKDTQPKNAANAFRAGMTMLQQSHFEARRLISGVRPPILDEEGIIAALAHLVNEERRKKGPKIEFRAKVEFDRLTPILENAVYRIAQEALTNASRHSHAKKVHVELVQCDGTIRIEVSDQGVGFRPDDVGDSRFGLAGIHERARLLGGRASVETAPREGTRVVVELPLVLRTAEDDA